MDSEKATFVKIDKFESVVSALNVIKKRITEAQMTLDKINTLKQEEDSVVQKWTTDLNSVQAKVENLEVELRNE